MFVVSIVLAAAGLASCSPAPKRHAATPTEPPRPVRLASVERVGGLGLERVPGVVAARQRAMLASRITARVVQLPFREGERVKRDAVVVRLDDAALRGAEKAAEAALHAAEVDMARVEALLATQAATPRERDEAAARASAARAGLLAARNALAYAVLRAPFDGFVAARPVNVGDVVSPGAPLLDVEGDGGLEIRATAGAALAGLLHPGQTLACEIDGLPVPVRATVRSLSPSADPLTHRFELRADVPAAAGLRSGLFARLLVPRPGAEERLLVPQRAILERGGLSGVFVVAENRAWLRWVAVGRADHDAVELRAGVQAGEQVVVDPAGLTDGAAVEGRP
jgi:RND family efflux transporter MFP subunit